MLLLTAAHMRAARGLLDWSQPELAERSGVGLGTIKRMENLGPGRSSAENVATVQRTLEAAGIEFLNDGRPGVRLAAKRDASE